MKKVVKHVIADGSAINIDLGFIPDHIFALEGIEETNPKVYHWWRESANTTNTYGQYGFVRAATGDWSKCADADNGFATYDTSTLGVAVPAADGNGETTTSIAGYSTTTTYTARSTTAVGSVIRPTTRNGFVYECTTASGGAAGTEPTWGTTVGGSTTAGSGDVWICRDEKTRWYGAKGITIGSTLSTDSDEWIVEAEKFDKVGPEVDSASVDPV